MVRTKRANIDDVVRLTGLSRATIDRVLNARAGVSAATRERVERALQELGFAPDAMTRRKMSPPQVMRVLLSRGSNPFFTEIEKGFVQSVRDPAYQNVQVHFDGFDPYQPETVVQSLRSVPTDTTTVVTVGVDAPAVEEAINHLVDRGVRVVTIVSDVPNSKRAAYVGQDNFSAGKTAGRLMSEIVSSGTGQVGVLIGHLQFRHLLDRQSGFLQTLGLKRPDLTLVPTRPYGSDPEQSRHIVDTLVQQNPALKGVYLCGGGQPHLIRALSSIDGMRPVMIGHEVTAEGRDALADGTYRAVVAHDVLELSRKAIDAAVSGTIAGFVPCSINVFMQENLPSLIT